MPLIFENDEELNLAEDEKIVEVALDSGSVDHITDPDDLPSSCLLVKPPGPPPRPFVGAGGHDIKRLGKVEVIMEPENPEDGEAFTSVQQVASVTRPLHAAGRIADADKEILITKGEAFVVPGGSLSKYLKGLRIFARYKRNRGLYTARMKVKDPNKAKPAGFARPGTVK